MHVARHRLGRVAAPLCMLRVNCCAGLAHPERFVGSLYKRVSNFAFTIPAC